MTTARALRVINPLLGLVLFVQAISGMLFDQMYAFSSVVHKPNGFLLVGLVIVHLYFNWRWVVQTYFRRRPQHTGATAPTVAGEKE